MRAMFPLEQHQPPAEQYSPEQLHLIRSARELLEASDRYAGRVEYRGYRPTTFREKTQLFGAFVLGTRAYPDTGEPAEFPNLAWKHTERVNIDSVRIRNLPVTLTGIWRELRHEVTYNLDNHETTQVLLIRTRGDTVSTSDTRIEVIDDVVNILSPTADRELVAQLQGELDDALARPHDDGRQS